MICSRVLHHVSDLAAASQHLARLLTTNGALIVDEFDWSAADAATAAWFYGTRRLLIATGTAADDDWPDCSDPLARWQHEHSSDPPLYTGAQIRHTLQRSSASSARTGRGSIWANGLTPLTTPGTWSHAYVLSNAL